MRKSGQAGSAMVSAMIAGSITIAGVVIMVNNQNKSEKIQRTSAGKSDEAIIKSEIHDFLSSHESCIMTMNSIGTINNDANIPAILDSVGAGAYVVGDEFANRKITAFSVKDYSPGLGLKYQRATISLTLNTLNSHANKSEFGGKSKTYKIPLHLITLDNKVEICMSDDLNVLEGIFKSSCQDLGGSYDSLSGECREIDGPNGIVVRHLKENFCQPGGGCTYPQAGESCTGSDVRGVSYNNWVVKGFNTKGDPVCVCKPISCPSPGSSCLGVDLGTDHCSNECGTGTKTTGVCKIECASWGNWSPDESTACIGTPVAQSRSCLDAGSTETQSRTVDGTNSTGTCSAACSSWGNWSPNENTACVGTPVAQNRSCLDAGSTETQSRTVDGTNSTGACSAACSSWGNWSPLDNTVCIGSPVTQNRSCLDAGSTETQSRTVDGTKGGAACCNSWSSWAPLENTVCKSTSFDQTRACNTPGITVTENKSSTGTKTDGVCSSGTWKLLNTELIFDGWEGTCSGWLKTKKGVQCTSTSGPCSPVGSGCNVFECTKKDSLGYMKTYSCE